MRAITNQTGTAHWDAHGRLIQPGGVIAFEAGIPPAPGTSESSAPPMEDPLTTVATAPLPETKGGKGSSK
ncbi:hypothetical protein J7643_03685 [bacterium]|nr:hypothetical protein [bacterium]